MTVTALGPLYLSAQAHRAMRRPGAVLVAWDPDRRAVTITPADPNDPRAYAVTRGRLVHVPTASLPRFPHSGVARRYQALVSGGKLRFRV